MLEPANSPADRRPIAARHWRASAAMAGWLARAGVSPNFISIFGMLCGIGAGVSLGLTSALPDLARLFWLLAAGLILGRLLSNMFDGMVALATGQASPVGELYNEVPDRVSDSAVLVGLGYSAGGDPVLGFSAACLAQFVAYVRAAAKCAGSPQDYCGPMAKQHRMFTVIAVALWCGLAPSDWQPAWGESKRGLAMIALALIIMGCILTALRRLRRAANHLRQRP